MHPRTISAKGNMKPLSLRLSTTLLFLVHSAICSALAAAVTPQIVNAISPSVS